MAGPPSHQLALVDQIIATDNNQGVQIVGKWIRSKVAQLTVILTLLLLGGYVLVYIGLSVNGKYAFNYPWFMNGQLTSGYDDHQRWCIYGTYDDATLLVTEMDHGGSSYKVINAVFMPLIKLDRMFWHETIYAEGSTESEMEGVHP